MPITNSANTNQPFHERPQRSLRVASPKNRRFFARRGEPVTAGKRKKGLSIVSPFMNRRSLQLVIVRRRLAESQHVFGSGADARSNGVPRPFVEECLVSTFGHRFGSCAVADKSNTGGSKLLWIVREKNLAPIPDVITIGA